MDVTRILAQLRQEREQIEEALLSLERLARSRGGNARTASGLDVRNHHEAARPATKQQAQSTCDESSSSPVSRSAS
jgi:hypothetical protein